MTPAANPPSVSEMVAIMRRRPAWKALLAMDVETMSSLVNAEPDPELHMLASVLATMTAGQRKLLAWKSR